MDKRSMGRNGEKVSLLGFGCMRFPVTKDEKIDEIEAEKMLDAAYAGGVNYYDTAWPYHNGTSEAFVGRAMKKYPRDSFYFATKFPCWAAKTLDDAKRIFNVQLEHLQTDYVDFYMLHALDKGSWDRMVSLGIVDYFATLLEEGRIKNYGFSFHDSYEAFEEIASYRAWDFLQIQYNYMDIDEQAGDKGYALAKKLGIPIIVMEPIKGGNLASFPQEITSLFTNVRPVGSTASWALRWVAHHDQVKLILSGMTTMEQVKDNLNTFSPFVPLSPEEESAIVSVREALRKRVNNGCTGCRYCMPCPYGVDIPANFSLWNLYGVFQSPGDVMWNWGNAIADDKKAKNCAKCGVCEEACPQHIEIRRDLAILQVEMDAVYAANKGK